MKIQFRFILISVWTITLFIVHKSSNADAQIKDVKFPVEKNLVSKSIDTPPVIYSMHSGLVITGKYLVLIESKADHVFSVFKLPDCRYLGGFGILGRGPNEIGYINEQSATPTQSGIRIFDIHSGLLKIDISDFELNKKFTLTKIAKFPPKLQMLNDPFLLNDSTVCGIPYPQVEKTSKGDYISRFSSKPYITYNLQSGQIDYFGKYPNIYPKVKSDYLWIVYFHKTVVKPDQQKFASFGNMIKMLSLYNSNSILEKESILRTQDNFFDGEYIRKNALMYYTSVKATDKYIFAICENVPIEEIFQNKPTLEIWDWNANPIACFNLDRPVAAFDVTPDSKTIYFIDHTTQDKIFVCEINGLLR